MSPVDELLLVVLGLYIYEATLLVPRDAIALGSWWGRRFKLRRPAELAGGGSPGSTGLLLAPLLPPLGTLFVCQAPPVVLSPEGIVPPATNAPNVALLRFDGTAACSRRGKSLLAGAIVLARFDSEARAAEAASWLAEIAALPAAQRAGAIRARMRASLDVAAVRERCDRFDRRSGTLRLGANALFLLFAGVLPWQARRGGLERSWPWLLLALALLVAWTIWNYLRAHRSLYPARAGERRRQAVAFALAPLEAVRAVDWIARGLLSESSPVAAALALAPRDAALELARKELLAARHPLRRADLTDEALAARDSWCAAWAEELDAALRRSDVDVEALLRPPARESSASTSWCPRCLSKYGAAAASCADCPGVALVRFGDEKA